VKGGFMSEEQKDGRQLSKQEKWEDKLLKRQKRKLEMAQRENTDFVSTRVRKLPILSD